MQLIKTVLKVLLLAIIIILVIQITKTDFSFEINSNYTFIQSLLGFLWIFISKIEIYFIYLFVYLLILYYFFYKKIVKNNYYNVLFFTFIYYFTAGIFSYISQETFWILRCFLSITFSSVIIYYFFKRWFQDQTDE